MNIAIRRLERGDANLLAAFYNGLSEAAKRTFRPLGVTTSEERCEQIICDNDAAVDTKHDLVALDGGRIVGWSFVWSLDSDAPTFGLGIADECQGRGLGRMLMDRVLQAAADRGIRKIRLTVVQDNHKARRMYERRGFVLRDSFVGEDGLPYHSMVAAPFNVGRGGPQRDVNP